MQLINLVTVSTILSVNSSGKMHFSFCFIILELGPLDPNWFEVLTARASINEGNVADNDDLCANQEGHFKAPLEKTAAESQLFSTPKVFRHSRIVSPDTSFTAPPGTVYA